MLIKNHENSKHQKSNFKEIPMTKFKITNKGSGECTKCKINGSAVLRNDTGQLRSMFLSLVIETWHLGFNSLVKLSTG
jgi:hypothetical protein